uniref:Uncharacterized protein n=1 Tax=Euplotes crassus TaxID=5936 RepID=A0A7S3KGD1_EUPCR
MPFDDLQKVIDDKTQFDSYIESTQDFITREDYSKIFKDDFIKIVEKLLSEFGLKPTWAQYSSLWGTYETEIGSSEEDMEDPKTLIKYLKDVVQEYIWLSAE